MRFGITRICKFLLFDMFAASCPTVRTEKVTKLLLFPACQVGRNLTSKLGVDSLGHFAMRPPERSGKSNATVEYRKSITISFSPVGERRKERSRKGFMQNQTAVTGFRVPAAQRSQWLTEAAGFIRENFTDAILYGRSDLRCHLLGTSASIPRTDKTLG